MIEENIIEIKKLVKQLNCMGTYGLVELQLNEIESKFKNLNKDVQTKEKNRKFCNKFIEGHNK